MIISDKYRYVYIGIPRTGSKSMNHWLVEYFDGRWHGGHHDYDIPEEAANYLVFTIVRNPYDRATSSHLAVTWDDEVPKEHELGPYQNEQERLRMFRAALATREKQQREPPRQSVISLDERIRAAIRSNEEAGHGMNQKGFVDRGRVNLVLHFERLPECLAELPFVDGNHLPPFPHHPERGIRPPGDFFKFFADMDEELVIWAHAAEDFEAFGYRRFECGLPEDAPGTLRFR